MNAMRTPGGLAPQNGVTARRARATKPAKPASRAISRGKTAVEDGMSRQRYHWHHKAGGSRTVN
jgi:hypothetical protein